MLVPLPVLLSLSLKTQNWIWPGSYRFPLARVEILSLQVQGSFGASCKHRAGGQWSVRTGGTGIPEKSECRILLDVDLKEASVRKVNQPSEEFNSVFPDIPGR